MNSRGASTPLTWFFIAILAGVAAVAMMSLAQQEFYEKNVLVFTNDTYLSEYADVYQTIDESGQQISPIAKKDFSLSENVASFFTTAWIGISSLRGFLSVIPLIENLLNTITVGPLQSPAILLLIGFLSISVAIYVTMKALQSIRNQPQEP